MAGKNSNTTDKLVIDIKVNVKKGATTQITNLTKSLTKLNEVVKNTANIEKYANALRTIGKELTRTTGNKGISKVQGNANLLETKDVDVKKQKQQTKEIQSQEKSLKNITKEKQKQVKIDKDSNKENKKASGFFAKFTRSIGRIALYRAIRASLSGIVKMFKEGLNNLRAFDKTTDNSFKKMEASANTFKNSLVVLSSGIIQGVTPYIVSITDAIAKVINKISEAKAVLNGSDKYMKILTSDTKEWKEQVEKATGSLLEFDKFISLDKDSTYTGFVESDVSMSNDEAKESLEDFSALTELISDVGEHLKYLWKEVIKPLWNGLKDLLPQLIDIVSYLHNNVVTPLIEALMPFIPYIVQIIGVILRLVSAFLPTLNPLVSIIVKILELILPVLEPILMILEAIVSVVETIVMLFTDWEGAMDRIKNMKFNDWFGKFSQKSLEFISFGLYKAPDTYANGGMVDKGTSFIAGEAGAEVVHTSARGTGVTNIEQFSQAMLQALATYGVARGSDVSFNGNVYIDRTKAGQLLEGSVYGEGVRVGHFKRV